MRRKVRSPGLFLFFLKLSEKVREIGLDHLTKRISHASFRVEVPINAIAIRVFFPVISGGQ